MAEKILNFMICCPLKLNCGLTEVKYPIYHNSYNLPLCNYKTTSVKYLNLILLLLIIVGCNDKTERKIFAQNLNNISNYQRTELNEKLLKYVKYTSHTIAFLNAKVFDGNGNPAKENQTLIIINGYIGFIGNGSEIKVPNYAEKVDLKGKTIMPGIVGVHNHLHIPRFPFVGDVASKLYLASGVTTIQTCGSASPFKEVELAKKIENGEAIGPKVFPSAPYFTGKGGNPNMIIPKDAKQIRDTIQFWTDKGVKWFKVYRNTNPDDLAIIIEEAHKQSAKVTGHLCSITFEQATNLGIDGIEHGFNTASDFRSKKTYGICNGSREYIDTLEIDSDEVKKLQKLMIDNEVYLTSTLAIFESSIPQRGYAEERALKILSPFLINQYQKRRKRYDSLMRNNNLRERRFKKIMQFEYQFYKMGGTLTAGVDAGRHVVPGFGDQRNFELLKETGFSTEEAIKVMTKNGAKVLSENDIGTIDVGKKADFIIINGEINNNIRDIEYVFRNGYGYDPILLLKDVEGKFGTE